MRNYAALSILLALMVCLCGCNQNQAEQTGKNVELAENKIRLYEVKADTVVELADAFLLKTPDVLTSCVEDIMKALISQSENTIDSYTYMLGEESSLSLDITLKALEYRQEDIVLLSAAITKTMFQMDEITGISLAVRNSAGELFDEQFYTRDSFYYYDYAEATLKEETVCIYAPNSQGTALVHSIVKKQSEPNISEQELIINELERMGVLPEGTKVNQVTVYQNICYLDLSGEFNHMVSEFAPEYVIYAVVNSVIEQTGVEAVQIMLDGKIEPLYRNLVEIAHPLEFQSELIEK